MSPFDPAPRTRTRAGALLALAVPTVRKSKQPSAHESRQTAQRSLRSRHRAATKLPRCFFRVHTTNFSRCQFIGSVSGSCLNITIELLPILGWEESEPGIHLGEYARGETCLLNITCPKACC